MSGTPGPHHKTAKTEMLPKMSHRYLTWGAVKGVKPSKKVSAAEKLGRKKNSLGTTLERIRGEDSIGKEETMGDAQKTTMKSDVQDRLSGVLKLIREADAAGKKAPVKHDDANSGNGSSKPKAMPGADGIGLDGGEGVLTQEHYRRLASAAIGAIHGELATMGIMESGKNVQVSRPVLELVLEAVRSVVDDSGALEG